jgi:hypothetical protein
MTLSRPNDVILSEAKDLNFELGHKMSGR